MFWSNLKRKTWPSTITIFKEAIARTYAWIDEQAVKSKETAK